MSKDKLIPELRFPEFEGDGEWIYKRLGETGKVITGKTPSTKDASLWNGEILFITPTDIDENQKYQLVTNRTIVRNRKLNILTEGSIAYTCIASIGKMSITAKESVTNQQINSIVVNANYHNEFIYYSLLHITPFIKSRPATSTLPIVNKTEFSAFRIGVPIPQEQQKIASCLSSLDELIAAHNDKLDALKDHKKGLLQNLFPQEGETVPKIRFPEFEGDGEWVEDKLSNCADVVDPHPSHRAPIAVSDGIPFIGIGDISEQGELNLKNVRLVPREILDEHRERYRLKIGDFAYGRVASVGKVVDLSKNIDKDYTYSPTMAIVQPKRINASFLRHLCNSSSFITQVIAKTSGSTRKSIGMQNLRILNISMPSSLEEQQKIASCLSAVDELITAQQEKIDELQQHKKGLMQGLFPKMTD